MQSSLNRLGSTLLLVAATSAACTSHTRFDGQPTVASGRLGCERKCAAQKMELVGMVMMGEYSDGCICQIPDKTVARGAVAGAGQAVARIVVETERATRPPQRKDQNRFAKRHDLTLDVPTFGAKSRQSPTAPQRKTAPKPGE